MSKIPNNVKSVRKDLSDWVWHFTRRNPKLNEPVELDALIEILRTGFINGGCDSECTETSVCLTDMPLIEAIRQSPKLKEASYARFSDYGVGFRKKWLFGQGGLPVIYHPRDRIATDFKPTSHLRWRVVGIDLVSEKDYTWQREWRVRTTHLPVYTSEVLVVVRDHNEAMKHLCINHEIDFERDEVYFDVDWSYVTQGSLVEADADGFEAFIVRRND